MKKEYVEINFEDSEIQYIENISKKMWFKGKSNIQNYEKRLKQGLFDQFIGQLGELALFKFVYKEAGFQKYKTLRENKNKNLYAGDEGKDLDNLPVDIKCSYIRNKNLDFQRYHLWIREKEYHNDFYYILSLAEKNANKWKVYLLGWTKSEKLNKKIIENNIVRYEILAKNLLSMNKRKGKNETA
jgi:hypothetical protein